MKDCPKCGESHEKSGKFCSRTCANARVWSKEQNAKRAKSNKKFWAEAPEHILDAHRERCRENSKIKSAKRNAFVATASYRELTVWQLRERILIEQCGQCDTCGLYEWQGKYITLECDHIDGDNENNDRENLRYLCPNCHAQTPTWRGRKNKVETV